MMRSSSLIAALGALLAFGLTSMPALAQSDGVPAERAIVYADAPSDLSVTIYRDPERLKDEEMNTKNPRGFAMISEARRVTLPPGESTIRFEGVAEGMVGVSAIVTGLPGGTIEKNRNAELLSPAALVNGALGNRITITRTNPATGEAVSEQAVVRTRADGGLVLQTGDSFEAVRCAGIAETLGFDRVPEGLSAQPVFSIDTRDENGGTYEVTLTYLSWGFDWQANYIASLKDKGGSDDFEMGVLSWLTVLNDNAQSFVDAQLLVVAGELNVVSDYQGLASPPRGEPLRLSCYPIGSTAAGSAIPRYANPLSLAEYEAGYEDGVAIVVTARKRSENLQAAPMAVAAISAEVMEASEEQLGDLKLYRVPERVTVSAQGIKQVAFLNRDEVSARYIYEISCEAWTMVRRNPMTDIRRATILLQTENETEQGLGIALPQGAFNLFEPSSFGPLLVNENALRDYAVGQDIELDVGQSQHVSASCAPMIAYRDVRDEGNWREIEAELTNANGHSVKARIVLGRGGAWRVRWPNDEIETKDGNVVGSIVLAPYETRKIRWSVQSSQ
ncbi:MAG: hypothetical protein ABJK59_00635 [Erythrobacter sp.]|uniref:DUF4139 domain-containing protein n=1 Tax=Erythrobacter sp. TaxID=1042 RepID=UPI003298CDE1